MNSQVILFEDDHHKFLVSTRLGGFSSGSYASLNLGLNTGDDNAKVEKNRHYYLKSVLPDNQIFIHAGQVHGAEIATPNGSGFYAKRDGFFCKKPHLTASITIADCYPVFLADRKTGFFSLLHMGWRGTTAGIMEKALELFSMNKISAKELIFSIGPGIGFNHFEVGPDVKKYFPQKYYVGSEEEKGHLDLGGFIIDQFIEVGGRTINIFDSRECTFENRQKYYSYRRDGVRSGRMLALAWNKIRSNR